MGSTSQAPTDFATVSITYHKLGQTNQGEDSGFEKSPSGYTMCNAQLTSTQQLDDGTVFTARILRNKDADGLGWYASLQVGGGDMEFNYRITYVRADPALVIRLTKEGTCHPQNTCPFRVSHWDSNNNIVFNCDKADGRPDLWVSP
jgi:hypothetical protein